MRCRFRGDTVATDQSNRAKLITMLLALEGQLREADALSQVIERKMGSETFAIFRKFRSRIDEMLSLSAIIERRIEEIMELDIRALNNQFVKLNVHALTMLVRSNKNFFNRLAERRAVPMGIGDVLAAELKFLETVRERLSQPIFEGHIDQQIFEDLDEVMTAIRTISERTSSLEDFSDAPSLTDWTRQQTAPSPTVKAG